MKTSKFAQSALTAIIFSSSVLLSSASVAFAGDRVTEPVKMKQAKHVENQATKLNINLANLEQLITLPGIGRVKANAIINYRKDVGLFKSVEDIQNIKGIGTKLFAKLADKIKI